MATNSKYIFILVGLCRLKVICCNRFLSELTVQQMYKKVHINITVVMHWWGMELNECLVLLTELIYRR